MQRNVYLLLGVILLYLIPSLILSGIYGPSYGFLQGDNCWVPDGHGGWEKHGEPTDAAPAQPSVVVPLAVRYIPIFLPGLLLVLFLFTPLGRKLNPPTAAKTPGPSEGPEGDHPAENGLPPDDKPSSP
jgi:hypothetical protein